MDRTARFVLIVMVLLLCAGPSVAQKSDATPAETKKAQGEAAEQESEGEEPAGRFRETVVVTASRTEQSLHEVPAAMTVLTSAQIEQTVADDYGDYLRNVPGLNVSQMSARDIQISGRTATASLATNELVLLDNRTLYLDFFGFVMWDFMPMDPREIKQIEVVRGPGSAVWGANAMSGVINVITKTPAEMQGTTVTLGGGELGTGYASLTHAGVAGKLGYKVSGAFYEQDPYDRPTGAIPGSAGPTNPTGTPYPPFANQGTSQPKLNLRFDWETAAENAWSVATGYAGTDGIIHSGIGPFDIDSGTFMSYAKIDWSREAMRVTFFANVLDGDADNLLTRGVSGNPLAFAFESETYNVDFSNTTLVGDRHILTYGANARRNDFDLSIAPQGDKREEFGVFFQDDIRLSEKIRWLLGLRWDDIDPIGSVVSPRTTLMVSPWKDHTFRLSYNRAFRAPSMINNFLDITIVNVAVLPTGPYAFPSRAVGNIDLQEERLDAVELGYVGSLGKLTTLTVSVYRNELKDSADFFQATAYTAANPPPNFPLNPAVLDVPPPNGLQGQLPESFSYRNVGEIIDEGVELSLNVQPIEKVSVYLNYSFQDEPEVSGIDRVTLPNGTVRDAVNTPPEHRANLGFAFDGGRFFVNANVNHVTEAFWTDVLDSRFWGPTDDFTQVNLGAGLRLAGELATVSLNAQNLFDEDVQQHVFGDLLSRKVTGQVTLRF